MADLEYSIKAVGSFGSQQIPHKIADDVSRTEHSWCRTCNQPVHFITAAPTAYWLHSDGKNYDHTAQPL